MELAVLYVESLDKFKTELDKLTGVSTIEIKSGRRFDRVLVDGVVQYFVDRHSWEIFGAKSSFQYNPRRFFGKLDTVDQFDWGAGFPKPGTNLYTTWWERENAIVAEYKPRGRPKKVVPTTES